MNDIIKEIEELKNQLKGDMLTDMEIKDKIHNLEMKLNGTKPSLMNYDQALYALDDIQSDLTKKYNGEFKINLETGELIREDVINS